MIKSYGCFRCGGRGFIRLPARSRGSEPTSLVSMLCPSCCGTVVVRRVLSVPFAGRRSRGRIYVNEKD